MLAATTADNEKLFHVHCLNRACGHTYYTKGRPGSGTQAGQTIPPTFCERCESFAIERDGHALCPACSGPGAQTDDARVRRCTECGGVFTVETIDRASAWRLVKFSSMLWYEVPSDQLFSFDLSIEIPGRGVERVHGVADRKSKRVVQYG